MHYFGPKVKNCSFLKVSGHFQKKLIEKSKFKAFTGSSLTFWARGAARSGTGGCRGRSSLPCTHVGRACKKPPCFVENWMNFLKMLVLTLNWPELLRYNRLKLPFLFFFLVSTFQSILGLNGLITCSDGLRDAL